MKKLLSLILAMILVLSLVACGGGSSNEPAPSKEPEATETPAATDDANTGSESSDRPYYVRDASEVTGKVVCYTTMVESEQQLVKELFNKYYPDCAIEFVSDSVGTLITRVRSDSSNNADVMLGGMFAADGDKNHDILQPYIAACDEEQLYHDPDGYFTFYDVQLMCLVVNPELRDQLGIEINGYEDLLQPELKGKIIVADPAASSSGWRQLQTILAVMGDEFGDEKAWDYLEKLLPNCYSTNSSKDVYNLVASGEYVVGLSYESGVVTQIKDGAPIEIVYMEEGNTVMPGGVAIIKDAPNLPAAQAIVDIVSSAEFQERRDNGRPSNGKAKTDLPALDTMKIVDLDYKYLNEHQDEIIERWNDILANN